MSEQQQPEEGQKQVAIPMAFVEANPSVVAMVAALPWGSVTLVTIQMEHRPVPPEIVDEVRSLAVKLLAHHMRHVMGAAPDDIYACGTTKCASAEEAQRMADLVNADGAGPAGGH